MLRSGERVSEGYWLRAERQTGGRGRRGRAWESPVGNLYCSTAVHLGPSDHPAHALSFVAALAVHDMLMEQLTASGVANAKLKWPNDVLVDGQKLAGILLELVGSSVVVGIGVNVAHAPNLPDRKATSIGQLNGHRAADASAILGHLAHHFACRTAQWRSEGLGSILHDWEDRAHLAGTRLSVSGENGDVLNGAFAGLDSLGALRLRLDDGTVRVIHAADVSVV
jgi:BirA family transcriptional regulator, biotin operon repressor / biotin---[acetyl-CoA-carboxylase] ligase